MGKDSLLKSTASKKKPAKKTKAAGESAQQDSRPVKNTEQQAKENIEQTPVLTQDAGSFSGTAEHITQQSTRSNPPDPIIKAFVFIVIVLAFLLVLITAASISNKGNYYIAAKNGALEISRGVFAPLGKEPLMTLHGVQAPKELQSVYTKGEVYRIIFYSYIEKADALFDVQGMPDFEGVKYYLNKALAFADTDELKTTVYARLSKIDLTILLYKADVAASKGTVNALNQALLYLKEALKLNPEKHDAEIIQMKINAVQQLLATSE